MQGFSSVLRAFVKAHMMDMFEDYRLEGCIRILISLNGNELPVIYDLKDRIDKRMTIYRKVRMKDRCSKL